MPPPPKGRVDITPRLKTERRRPSIRRASRRLLGALWGHAYGRDLTALIRDTQWHFLLIDANLEAVWSSGCSISAATTLLCWIAKLASYSLNLKQQSEREREFCQEEEEHNALRRVVAARLRGCARRGRRHRR